jgi:DNA-directed RNA polymerase III subunit RPC1
MPQHVAKIMTYPERVFKHNIEKLRKLVLNGHDEYPGARFVEGKDGTKKFLKFVPDRKKLAADLQEGDVVERHIMDGDVVLFNRQPSLHRNSIMAHIVKVLPWKTFRFNECACTPYNADFDGDEMNMHVPQTEEAKAEARMLMNVAYNLCVPKSGELIIGATQDFLTSGYLITKKDCFYDKAAFCQAVSHFTDGGAVELPSPSILKPIQLWTGKQVISVLLNPTPSKEPVRPNFELKTKLIYNAKKDAGIMCPSDGYIVVRNGELMCGQLDKAALGGGRGNLFHVLLKDYSPEITVDRMTKLARLSARWITNHGFSIGISDVTPSPVVTQKKTALISKGYQECDVVIQEAKDGTLKPQAGCDIDQTLEAKVLSVLSEIRDEAGKICIEELHPSNSPLIMTLCGSKGSKINISQMVACVGQQAGKFI